MLDSVPWDLGRRIFCTTSRRYQITLKQPGRREGVAAPGEHGRAWPEEKPTPFLNKPLTLQERNEWKTEKRVN